MQTNIGPNIIEYTQIKDSAFGIVAYRSRYNIFYSYIHQYKGESVEDIRHAILLEIEAIKKVGCPYIYMYSYGCDFENSIVKLGNSYIARLALFGVPDTEEFHVVRHEAFDNHNEYIALCQQKVGSNKLVSM